MPFFFWIRMHWFSLTKIVTNVAILSSEACAKITTGNGLHFSKLDFPEMNLFILIWLSHPWSPFQTQLFPSTSVQTQIIPFAECHVLNFQEMPLFPRTLYQVCLRTQKTTTTKTQCSLESLARMCEIFEKRSLVLSNKELWSLPPPRVWAVSNGAASVQKTFVYLRTHLCDTYDQGWLWVGWANAREHYWKNATLG